MALLFARKNNIQKLDLTKIDNNLFFFINIFDFLRIYKNLYIFYKISIYNKDMVITLCKIAILILNKYFHVILKYKFNKIKVIFLSIIKLAYIS